jgi:S-formylglutathione hydrolase FrmB
MDRDVKVEFMSGGWDINTQAFDWYNQSGLSMGGSSALVLAAYHPLGFLEGIHSWGYWGEQLQQMKPDLARVLGAAAAQA